MSLLETCASVAIISAVVFFAAPSLIRARENYQLDLSAWQTHETVTLPRGFQLTATAAPQFHKHGNAAPAGTITIWDRRMNSRRVVVNFTGRIKVE